MIIGVISEPEGITDAEVEAYIEDHKDVYKDGMFEEGIEDYPVPFVDFPAPINRYIARLEIQGNRKWKEDCNKTEEQLMEEMPSPFGDSIESVKVESQGEADVLNNLVTDCNLPLWEVLFYVKIYNEINYALELF